MVDRSTWFNMCLAFQAFREQVFTANEYKTDEDILLHYMFQKLSLSYGQIFQDLMVLNELGELRGGFFVEIGVCDGVKFSNTLLLEKNFGWRGIVAEPAKTWHEALRSSRSCDISTMCVTGGGSGTLLFNETEDPALSTLDRLSGSDLHAPARSSGRRYEVQTISINDLLESFSAPDHMQYLSIDTEGSEFEIIRGLDFARYEFDIISIEHNYTEQRELIFEHLSRLGYLRKYVELSMWDDWYFKQHELSSADHDQASEGG